MNRIASTDRPTPVRGETYYGRPAVKPSVFEWKTAAYIFVGGLAGAAQLIATVADIDGDERNRGVVSNGRYVALAGSAVGPVLLIWALHTPGRFYNMLRIFRPTSPMSIGAYTLTGFGLLSGVLAAAEGARTLHLPGARLLSRVARVVRVPAAGLGALMAVYTGALLASTSTPLWSAAPRLLAARFGAAATAAASSTLALLERRHGRGLSAERLEDLASLAAAAEAALAHLSDGVYAARGVDQPLRSPPLGPIYRWGAEIAGTLAPMGLTVANRLLTRRSGALAIPASVGMIIGSLALRMTILYAGNASAQRPGDYFRMTQG